MAFWSNWLTRSEPPARSEPTLPAPQAATQPSGGGLLISDAAQLQEYLRNGGDATSSGQYVTPDLAMRVSAVYACVRIISGAVATLPLHVKRRLDARTREDASDSKLWALLRRRPNRWQTPSQFRRMMQAHLLMRGNGYALIVRSLFGARDVTDLVPLHPDRVQVDQLNDGSLRYTYTTKAGQRTVLDQASVFHLVGLTLDGFTGVSPLTYARETVGLSLAMESHGGALFRNGTNTGMTLTHPGKLGTEGYEFLRASLDDYRAGGEREGKTLILEEGMTATQLAMTSEDAQWIESRRFSRSDIAMFFGVPPHMIGDTDKSTSWGSGIEQQSIGFVAYTLEDHLTMWEEAIARDLIADAQSPLYARFNRAALVKGDIKTRSAAYASGLQWGWLSPNEVRELEDRNPREGGDEFYEPPNTAGAAATQTEDTPNEPASAS